MSGLALATAGLTYLATRETDQASAALEAPNLSEKAAAPAVPKRHRKAPKHYSEA